MEEIDSKKTKNGVTVKLYRVKKRRPRYIIDNNPDTIIIGAENAFKVWDKIFDFTEMYRKGGVIWNQSL